MSKNRKKSAPAENRKLEAVLSYVWPVLFFVAACICLDYAVKTAAAITVPLALISCWARFDRLKERAGLILGALALVVVMGGISTFYAVAPKFALTEYLKMLTGFSLAVIVICWTKGTRHEAGMKVGRLVARTGAVAGIISIDRISMRILSSAFLWILRIFVPDYDLGNGVEQGVRMMSVFNNGNIFAGFVGVGVILALGFAVSAETKGERRRALVTLYINALSFLMAFSMGAGAMIALAFVVFLITEYKERRGGLLVLMVVTFVLVLVALVPIASMSLDGYNGFDPIPILCVIVGSVLLCLADKLFIQKASDALATRGKAVLAGAVAIIVLFAAFILAAYNLTGAATQAAGESLFRSAYPEAGECTLTFETSVPVRLRITSQNRQQAMMHTDTVLFEGESDGSAAFTVPEDSAVVFFDFSADEQYTVSDARYVGENCEGKVPLHYTLLPGFIARRIQGLFANQNAIQRLVFFSDGLKLFKQSPIIGRGLGGFENGVVRVQSFYYETKYAHNHYIQVLGDMGIIGLVLFLGLLVSCLLAIVRNRKSGRGSPLAPALGTMLFFVAAHAVVEIDFSFYSFIPLAYCAFMAINLCCGEELRVKEEMRKKTVTISTAVLAALAIVFYVFLLNNLMYRSKALSNPTFENFDTAIKKDKFEWADYALSYVMSANEAGNAEVSMKADKYAERLEKVDSNTIPMMLAEYYFQNDRVDDAFRMIRKHLDYVAASPEAWQNAFSLMRAYHMGTDEYMAGVAGVADMMNRWNENNMGTIELLPENIEYLQILGFAE